MNTTFNPYKNNIDMLRRFFAKPIVLIIALLFIFFTLAYEGFAVYSLLSCALIWYSEEFIFNSALAAIGLLNILPTVAFFQLFCRSRSKKGDMSFKSPVRLINVFSVICIIILCGCIALSLTIRQLVVPIIPISALLIISIIAMMIMFGAVKRSAGSIYLKKYGSGFLSAMSAIVAALVLAVVAAYVLLSANIFSGYVSVNDILIISGCALAFLLSVFMSVFAGKYGRFISRVCSTVRVSSRYSAASSAQEEPADEGKSKAYPDGESNSANYYNLPVSNGVNPYEKGKKAEPQQQPSAVDNPYKDFVPQNPFMQENQEKK